MADALADTLLMRLLEHDRMKLQQQRMDEQKALTDFNQFTERERERDREEFEKQFKMAQLESKLATTLGKPAPQFDDPRLQRGAEMGMMAGDIETQTLQRQALQKLAEQQLGAWKAQQPERTEQMKKGLGHISYLGHRPSSSGAGQDPREQFLVDARKIQAGYGQLKASLPEQLIMPEQRAQDARASKMIESINQLMVLVRMGEMSPQQAYQTMSEMPGFDAAATNAQQPDKMEVEQESLGRPSSPVRPAAPTAPGPMGPTAPGPGVGQQQQQGGPREWALDLWDKMFGAPQ